MYILIYFRLNFEEEMICCLDSMDDIDFDDFVRECLEIIFEILFFWIEIIIK